MREAIEQLAFEQMVEEAEEAERAALDRHRTNVQAWFDALSAQQKDELGDWMYSREWHTCQALSAAACTWDRSTSPAAAAIRAMEAAVAKVEACGRKRRLA